MVRAVYKYIILSMVALCVSGVFLVMQNATSYAEEVPRVVDLTTSNVYDDLKTSTINGAPFDVTKYPYDYSKNKVEFLNFVEYCYSVNSHSNYALYLYFYNPSEMDIDFFSNSNKVQIGTGVGDASITDYNKYNLIFCNKSTGAQDGLFLKFKISNALSIREKLEPAARRYHVSGFELFTKGAINAVEYPVALSFKYEGFAKGMGADVNADSTLKSAVGGIETIRLDVKSAFYRTEGASDLGEFYQNQVDSVYFSIPERFFETYGTLQKVKAEWYEYRTKPIIVCTPAVYDYTKSNIGKKLDKYDVASNKAAFYGGWKKYNQGLGGYYYSGAWAYNLTNNRDSYAYTTYELPYLFKSDSGAASNFVVNNEKLKEHIYTYKSGWNSNTLNIKGNSISTDLFVGKGENVNVPGHSIGRDRVYGYNVVDIDLDDTFDLKSFSDNNTGWLGKFFEFGLKAPITNDSHYNVLPIEEITSFSFVGDNKDAISKKLLVDKSQLGEMSNYVSANNGARTFVLRFANTDYYSMPLTSAPTGGDPVGSPDSYMAQQNVFLDFDIIQLTFKKDGDLIVIPVVSSPIDVIADITPPPPDVAQKIDNTIWYVLIGVGIVVVASCLGVFLLKGRR